MTTSGSSKKRRRPGISAQVFIGLGVGVLVGLFFGEQVAFLRLAGDAFIALLQITVIPYVVVALITSLGRLTLVEAKELGIKAGGVLLALWAIGLTVVFLSPLALPNWASASFFKPSQVAPPKGVDFLELYIPSNFFYSLSNAIVPAIVVFSILFGLALINVGTKQRVLDLLSAVGETLMAATGFIGRLAPYGVFAITAAAAGTLDVADLGRLQVYLVLYVTLSLLLSLWLIPGLVASLTPVRHGAILRTFRASLVAAFATGNVLIVLPLLAADSRRLISETERDSAPESGNAWSSVEILIPASFPFPNLGLVLTLMFVLFGGWYAGSTVELGQYPGLAVAGLASLFGGTVLALPFLFDLLRLPADLFEVFLTVDVLGSRFGTLLAAIHIIAIALIGSYALHGRVRLRAARLARFAGVSVVLLMSVLLGIRGLYTYVWVEPYTKGHLLTSLHLLGEPQPHTVQREPTQPVQTAPGTPPKRRAFGEDGVLRACYMLDDYPSAFFNDAGALVGFDVEMTHRFARHLGLAVDFIPARSGVEAVQCLDGGSVDVVMSLRAITSAHAERMAMSSPVMNAPVGLIVRDHDRHRFQQWTELRKRNGLRVAILNDPLTRSQLARLLPNAIQAPYASKQELEQILAAGAAQVDAVAVFAEEGAAWTLRFPNFTLATPSPAVFFPVGYAVARGDDDMLTRLDIWLLNARNDGTIDELYRYWMLGEVKQTQPPRWSVIRDLLGWIK